VFAGLLLPAGAIGDRYGRKGALLIGLVIFIAGALWSAWSGDANWLIVARGSMGIGAALMMPATRSIIVAVFSPAERAKTIAVWAGFAGAGWRHRYNRWWCTARSLLVGQHLLHQCADRTAGNWLDRYVGSQLS